MVDQEIIKMNAMKAIFVLLLCLIFTDLFSNSVPEKEIKSEVSEVTVFLKNAQVVRKKSVELPQGQAILKFTGLSPFVDPKSIQVKVGGDLMVLSVNHQQNFLDKMKKSEEMTELQDQLEKIEERLNVKNTHLSILREELDFLRENRDIGGRNDQVDITNLQQASEFYSKRLTSIKMEEIDINKKLKVLNTQKSDLQNQIRTLYGQKEYPTGEVLIKVDADRSKMYPIELSYLVANAGWFPSYDVRAKSISEPVLLIYRANVKQDTKVDWTDVKLKFSSADPNVSGVAPELKTYYLNYNTLPPSYGSNINNVRGKVVNKNGEALPGANIVVEGTTIGTVTDAGGNYSIAIPDNSSRLKYTFIGYKSQTLPVSGEVMNVALEENVTALNEVVIAGQGIKGKLTGSTLGLRHFEQAEAASEEIMTPGRKGMELPTQQVENQTTVDFEIKTPYTIESDNKNYTVDMAFYDLPAFYQYYSVPKIDKDAFLIANIIDWEKYNLLEGEANIFFEDTYVGKTILDVRYVSDTLEISLGRDKKVLVNREKIKDFTDKHFIGNKKEVTRGWKITVRNNKTQEINMIVLDQVPVSTLEEISVDVQNISGAKHDPETGELKWDFSLKPNDSKEFSLRYLVKYPKYRNLVVE